MKKILSVLLAAVILCFSCLTAMAADPAIEVSISRYDSNTSSYVDTELASSGDLLLVTVSVNSAISKLACINLNLGYNASVVSYVKNSATSHIVADDPKAGSPIYRDNLNEASPEKSYIQAYIGADTHNKQELAASVSGNLVSFLFTCTGVEGQAKFSVSITEIYDSTYHTIKLANKTASDSVQISQWELSAEEKAIFEKLTDITYPDSKEDIEEADRVVNGYSYKDEQTGETVVKYVGFTAAEMKKFQSAYPELFAAYSNAWNKYYSLAEDAILADVKKEANAFLAENKAVLKLTAEKVTAKNYQAVLDMYKSYDNLSAQAKLNIDSATRKNINALNEAAKALKKQLDAQKLANELAEGFINNAMYSMLWGLDKQTIFDSVANEESRLGLIDRVSMAKTELADLDIDNLSAKNKAKIDELKAQLDFISSCIDEAIAENEVLAAIAQEIAQFNEQWSDLFGINMFNVAVTDKTAFELMLKSYEKLSAEAKEELLSRKNNAEMMLALIEGLLDAEKEDTSGNTVIPGGDDKPSDSNTQDTSSQNTQSSSDTVSPEKEVVTETQIQTVTQTQTVEKVVEKQVAGEAVETVINSVRETPLFVKIMVLLALISMVLVFVPILVYCIKSKALRAFIGKEEAIDEDSFEEIDG